MSKVCTNTPNEWDVNNKDNLQIVSIYSHYK